MAVQNILEVVLFLEQLEGLEASCLIFFLKL